MEPAETFPAPPPEVEALFAQIDRAGPGCAVGATQAGRTLFAKGYGLADLEQGAPISPRSRFYVASVSKQLTAFATLSLAESGRIALDDPVRKWIPELPDHVEPVTLGHLLTHTSGLRDYLILGLLSGYSPETVVTDDLALRLLQRQRALNFAPGSDYCYSNSGYVLLSMVIERASGKRLDDYARETFFEPLGMAASRFQHDHAAPVPERAHGYERRGEAWRIADSMLDVVGDGGAYSNVADLLRWLRNLDEARVGAKCLALMARPAFLDDGRPTGYGMGLMLSSFRGLNVVEHGGGLAGYRTHTLHIPSEHLGLVVLCNDASAFPHAIARTVVAACLGSRLPPPPPLAEVPTEAARRLAGRYRTDTGEQMTLVEKDGRLSVGGLPAALSTLAAAGPRELVLDADPDAATLRFAADEAGSGLELRVGGEPARQYERLAPCELTPESLQDFAGDFVCDEVAATYRISLGDAGLVLRIGDGPPQPLQATAADRLTGPPIELTFEGGRDSFRLAAGRAWGLTFRRV